MSEPVDPSQLSDGYHTMSELYEQRALYHAAWLHSEKLREDSDDGRGAVFPDVVRSFRHSDGELCFGGRYFIVSMALPLMRELPPVYENANAPAQYVPLSTLTTQAAQHYPVELWPLFDFVRTVDVAPIWDGHTPAEGNDRLRIWLSQGQGMGGATSVRGIR